MKFTITMKDPDGVYESVKDAAEASIKSIEGIEDDEKAGMIETRTEKLHKAMSPWVEYGEYISVEFDTEAKTATVLMVRR